MKFHSLLAAGLLATTALAGCKSLPQVTPTGVANNISTIDMELTTALQKLPNAPPAVITALNDLHGASDAFKVADTNAAQQSVVQRVVADVEAVLASVPMADLPPYVQAGIFAAEVLLPVIADAVDLVLPQQVQANSAAAAHALAIRAGARL